MKQPNILVRIAGTPLISCIVFAGSALVICGWCAGQAAWWMALMAVGISFRTVKAMSAVRSYKAWRAEWAAMARTNDEPSAPAKRRRWKGAVLMATVLLTMPASFTLPTVQANIALLNGLRYGWLLLVLYCLFRLLRPVFRRVGSVIGPRRQAREAKAMDAPIAFAVGRLGGCPTRATFERNLPDYCLRLMHRN